VTFDRGGESITVEWYDCRSFIADVALTEIASPFGLPIRFSNFRAVEEGTCRVSHAPAVSDVIQYLDTVRRWYPRHEGHEILLDGDPDVVLTNL
jgi:hypothetical protein